MAAVSIQTQSRESWITPQEQLAVLAAPRVDKQLKEKKEDLESVEMVSDKIAASAIRSTVESVTGRKQKGPPSLFDIFVAQNLVKPQLPANLTNWYRALDRIGALPDIIPPLPAKIEEILKSPCPIHSSTEQPITVGETHVLYLLPTGTINELDERVRSYGERFFKGENPLRLRSFWNPARQEHANVQCSEPQWVLISKDVLPGSRNQRYEKQTQMVETLSAKSFANYQVPTLREAIGAVFLHKIATDESLYQTGNEQAGRGYTNTRVKETTRDCNLNVGDFAPSGLCVYYEFGVGNEFVGVAALRKFG